MRHGTSRLEFLCYLVPLALCAGCASAPAPHETQPLGQADLPALTALHDKATRPQRLSFRKPIRDERARAMHQLAERADAMLAESETWDADVRLTALTAPEQDELRVAVDDFRSSLRALEAAARAADRTALRTRHAAVVASYQNLIRAAGTEN